MSKERRKIKSLKVSGMNALEYFLIAETRHSLNGIVSISAMKMISKNVRLIPAKLKLNQKFK